MFSRKLIIYRIMQLAGINVIKVQVLHTQRSKQQLVYRAQSSNLKFDHIRGFSTTNSVDFGSSNRFTGLSFPTVPHVLTTSSTSDLPCILPNTAAAAILSTLIPPTLAATFTLTAQKVCAKCNISFRMTSDLVYHMRSHHKSEITRDANRRKREEKLMCSVSLENFRDRHHLTRHMTAHQDKDTDQQNITGSSNTTSENSSHTILINSGRQHVPQTFGCNK